MPPATAPTPIAANRGADLTYNIASGLLEGQIDGVYFSARAASGGRGGSKAPGALNWWLANNPFATHIKLPANHAHPGGPLPMGHYRLVLHESRHNWVRLIPCDVLSMHGRAGMAIHGQGQRGSDGCIVPTDFSVVLRLAQVLREREERGAAAPILTVIAVGTDLDRQFRTA